MEWGTAWRGLAVLSTTGTLISFCMRSFDAHPLLIAVVALAAAGVAANAFSEPAGACPVCNAGRGPPRISKWLHLLLRTEIVMASLFVFFQAGGGDSAANAIWIVAAATLISAFAVAQRKQCQCGKVSFKIGGVKLA